MFEATLLDSSTARRPVLGAAEWLLSIGIGFLGFLVGAMKIPTPPTPDGTKILLLRAAIVAGALMFYSLSVCYAYKDARRQCLRAWLWAAVVIVANLPGFLIYLVYSAVKTSDWKRATLPIAYTLEVLLVCLASLVPLIYTQALSLSFNITKPIPPPSQGARTAPPSRGGGYRRSNPNPNILFTPTVIPPRIDYHVRQAPEPPEIGLVGVPGLPNGLGGGGSGPIGEILRTLNEPPAFPKPAASGPKRIVSPSVVEAAKIIYMPRPEYPQLALLAHVQGTVQLHAIIGTDGTIQKLSLISGNPLLTRAALQTVATWRYQPTLLNGDPVEVDTEIDVIFKLND